MLSMNYGGRNITYCISRVVVFTCVQLFTSSMDWLWSKHVYAPAIWLPNAASLAEK